MVFLQALVFPGVAEEDDGNGTVEQRLGRGVVAVEVSSLVLAPGGGGLLGSRSRTLRKLLVEGHNLLHSLGVRVGAHVLFVSIQVCKIEYGFENHFCLEMELA